MLAFLPLALAAAATATPLQVVTSTAVERPVAAGDGTVRIVTVPGKRARPGDRLVVTLAYRNVGRTPIGDVVLADPVPRALLYRGPAAGSPEPELSVDGTSFAPLAALAAGDRPATNDDVTAVRWRLPGALAPGAAGTLAFRAVLK